MAHRIRVFVG